MIFKKKQTADIEMSILGFSIIQDDEKEICYKRLRHCNMKYHYIKISKRKNKVLISSFQEPKKNYKIYKSVALTTEEMELVLKKIKEKGWDKK